MTYSSGKARVALFGIIAVFFLLSLPNIHHPGISIDEADEAIACDFILKRNPMLADKVLIGEHVTIFGRTFPVAHGPYTGRTHAYLMFIFSRFFGVNVFSLRFTPIAISAITLVFIYLLCRMWFGCRVAAVACLLTATNLHFVQYSRLGHYREAVFVMGFFWAGLFLLAKYMEKRKAPLLYLSLFLFGLGLSTKITMLFYLVALTLALIFSGKEFHLLSGLNMKKVGLGLVSFCSGAFPLILYNAISGGKTVMHMLNSLTNSTSSGYSNLAYHRNLWERMGHLMDLLKGNIREGVSWGVTQGCYIERFAAVFVGLVFLSFIFAFVQAVFLKEETKRRKIAFLFILYAAVFFLTPFVAGGTHPSHLLVLLPFPQITLALLADHLWVKSDNKKMAFGVISFLLIPLLTFQLWLNIHFHQEMRKNGGSGRWSTTIYELSRYLKKEKIHRPVTFGFGLQENISFLTKYQVIPNQLEENCSLDYVINEYRRLTLNKRPIFYLTKKSEEYMPNLNLFFELAENDGRKKELHKVFFNSAGEAVYWLYRII